MARGGGRFAGAVHRPPAALVDALVPPLVGAVIIVAEFLSGGDATRPVSMALGLAAAASLSARRRWPGATLVSSGALVAVLLHVDRAAGAAAVLAPAVALYSVALKHGRRTQVLAGLAAIGAVVLADLLHPGRPGILQTLGHVLLVAIPLLAAEQVRTHRSYLSLLTEQAREQERVRIARDLHDVLAHSLTEINVQAAAAAERAQPGASRSALERIEDASHRAIGELRAVLGVLRAPDGGNPPRAPAPGIDSIPTLIERAGGVGGAVELEVRGERPAGMRDSTSLAAYRIVQESLTNARRHAPGAAVRVEMRFDSVELLLAVENVLSNGSAGNNHRPGIGIAGMRERASAVGGTLEAQPADGRFVVRARLPCR